MTIWDYLYFALVAVAILIWFAATVLYIDKKLRERRWRRRDEARGGYIEWGPPQPLRVLPGVNEDGTVSTRTMHDVLSAAARAEDA